MGDRWAVEMAEQILKKAEQAGKGQGIMLAEVVTVEPFSIKLHDRIVTKNLYVNPAYAITRVDQRLSDIPMPASWSTFLKEFHNAFTLMPRDQLVVLLQGTSFYVIEKVVKKA